VLSALNKDLHHFTAGISVAHQYPDYIVKSTGLVVDFVAYLLVYSIEVRAGHKRRYLFGAFALLQLLVSFDLVHNEVEKAKNLPIRRCKSVRSRLEISLCDPVLLLCTSSYSCVPGFWQKLRSVLFKGRGYAQLVVIVNGLERYRGRYLWLKPI